MRNKPDPNVDWQPARWPNFTRSEIACRHCGEAFIWPEFLDRLQALRYDIGQALHILSGHRCSLHNALVGGAPFSQHLQLAVDISLMGHNRFDLKERAGRAGFTGFGFYTNFLHLDLGKERHWYGNQKARDIWQAS